MSDTISRRAAIDAVKSRKTAEQCENGVVRNWAVDLCVNALEKLPSAQPEEVTPHRNYQYLSDYWCECGWHLGKMGDVNYCPNCGKKVKWDG